MLESILALEVSSIVMVCASSLSIIALIVSIKNGRTLVKQKKQQVQVSQRLKEDNRAMSKSAIGMGQKVLETERRLNAVLKKQYAILNSKPEHPSYDEANRLIKMGASEDDLVSSCGFSHGEAEVLLSLNKQMH
jgi:transcriptional regulator of NAD metabolism